MDRREAFTPQPDSIDELESRTRRAYTESMQVTLERTGGQYTVFAESGNTYTVDIVEETCTCADHRENDPKNGCKHRRRVEMEVRAKRVPTPDGRIPKRVASDGGTTVNSQVEDRNDTRRIRGPIPEFDAYGEWTGKEYYRCRACGAEAMRKRDLEDCCEAAES
jgi:hypothetical protein